MTATALPWLLACAGLAQQPSAPLPAATRIVEGRVLDMRGEGIPAARVWVAPRLAPDSVVARTVADGEGTFRLGKVPVRDDLRTFATADGYCTAAGTGDGNTTVVGLQHAATVTGVLRNRAGKPLAGKTVVAMPNGRVLFAVRCEATTDAEGRFVLRGVPLAPVHVCAWIPGEGIASLDHHVAADTEVALQPGDHTQTALSISVTGLPDDALAALRVGVMEQRHGDLVRLPAPLDRLQLRDGALQLEHLLDVEYRVTLHAPGWRFAPPAVRAQPGKGPHVAAFTATRVATTRHDLAFTAHDAAGQPIAGLPVSLRPPGTSDEVRATTAADGTAMLTTTVAVGDRVWLRSVDARWALSPGATEGRPLTDTLHNLRDRNIAFDPSQTLALRFAAACSVRGRLLRTDGRPAPFAWVELQEHRTNGWPEWSMVAYATTDRDGHFEMAGLHPIAATLRLCSETALGTWARDDVDLGRAGTSIRVPEATLAAPATVEGVVRDANQRPVAGIRVQRLDWDPAQQRQRTGNVDETLTDRDGRFRFVGVPPGDGSLRVVVDADDRPFGSRNEMFSVAPAATAVIDLELPAR